MKRAWIERFRVVLAVGVAAGIGSAASAQATTRQARDTLYAVRRPSGTVLRQHGDTSWAEIRGLQLRMVRHGDTVLVGAARKDEPLYSSEWIIRGDSAHLNRKWDSTGTAVSLGTNRLVMHRTAFMALFGEIAFEKRIDSLGARP